MTTLLHVAENQLDGLWFIDALLDSLGIVSGTGMTLGNNLIRYQLGGDKVVHIVKDHCKVEVRCEPEGATKLDLDRITKLGTYRRLATEVLAQLGYRYRSLLIDKPTNGSDPWVNILSIVGIQLLDDDPQVPKSTPKT